MKNEEDTWITVAKSPEFFQAAILRAQRRSYEKYTPSFWSLLRPGDLFRSSKECERVQKNLANGVTKVYPFDLD